LEKVWQLILIRNVAVEDRNADQAVRNSWDLVVEVRKNHFLRTNWAGKAEELVIQNVNLEV